ncbi:MAG: hypothetical protein ACLFUU_13355 [Desulfobacteraceae bacterium]
MARKLLATSVAIIFIASFLGCATNGHYDPARSAGAGALGGAATGAAIGSIIGAGTGSAATGAWVGAATGAVAGGIGGALYAAHRNQKQQDYDAAAQSYNYTPSQGNVVDINTATVSPDSVRPGQQVNMQLTYTILTPGNAPVDLTISREIKKDGLTMGQPHQTQVSNTNGTYSDQVGFMVPDQAAAGKYTIISRVNSNYGSDQEISYFTVM